MDEIKRKAKETEAQIEAQKRAAVTFKEFVESYNKVKTIRANEELKLKKIKSELEYNEHLAMEESKEVEFTPMRGFGKKFK